MKMVTCQGNVNMCYFHALCWVSQTLAKIQKVLKWSDEGDGWMCLDGGRVHVMVWWFYPRSFMLICLLWFTFLWAEVDRVSNSAPWCELLHEFIESIYNLRLCNIIGIVLHFINTPGLFSLGQIPQWPPQWIWLVMPHPSSDSVTYEWIHFNGMPYIHLHWNL